MNEHLKTVDTTLPHTIHYCWFGKKKLPASAVRCIDSWKRFFPEHDIVRWDETNFDVDTIPFTRDAYAARKYAFVSDFARFDILCRQGGIYFDTDVDVIRRFDNIIANGPFMGMETSPSRFGIIVAAGLGMGAVPGMELLRIISDTYRKMDFSSPGNQTRPVTVATVVTDILKNLGLADDQNRIQHIAGFNIYPPEYMCPLSTIDGKLRITPETVSIHRYDQSWQSPARKYGRRILLSLGGERLTSAVKSIIFKQTSK